jgi:hypothetical protein
MCSSARISPAAPLYWLCRSIRRRHSSCRARQGRQVAYCEAAINAQEQVSLLPATITMPAALPKQPHKSHLLCGHRQQRSKGPGQPLCQPCCCS